MKKITLEVGRDPGIGKEVCQQIIHLNFKVLLWAENKDSVKKATMTLGNNYAFAHLNVNNRDNEAV